MPSLKEIERMTRQQVLAFPEPKEPESLPAPVQPSDYKFNINDAWIRLEVPLTAEYDNMILAYVYDRNEQGYIILHDREGNLIQPGKGQTTRSTINALAQYLNKRFVLGTWEGKQCVAHII